MYGSWASSQRFGCQLVDSCAVGMIMEPDEFTRYVGDDIVKWEKLIKVAREARSVIVAITLRAPGRGEPRADVRA